MRSKRLANKNNKFGSKIINHFNGEENENLLFMKNASIYVFIPENKFKNGNEPVWKKIGTGILKILKDKVDKKLRLVLRQKGVLNICANFRLDLTRYPLEINEFNQKQVFLTGTSTFFGAVNSVNLYKKPPLIMKYAIKFKNFEIVKDFCEKVNNHKNFIPLRRSSRIAMLERVNYNI
jgi:hypothetical protein